jgi:WD40 repeat protein
VLLRRPPLRRDGRRLHARRRGGVSCSYDGSVRVWELATGSERENLRDHRDWTWSISVHRSGLMLSSGGGGRENGEYVAGDDFGIRVWRLPAAK